VSYWARNFPTGSPNQTKNKNCRWPGGVATPLSITQKHLNFEIGTMVRYRICLLIGRRNPKRNPLGFALPEGGYHLGTREKHVIFGGSPPKRFKICRKESKSDTAAAEKLVAEEMMMRESYVPLGAHEIH
jgi:hypothetical protein